MTLVATSWQRALRLGADTLVTILAAAIARATASQQQPPRAPMPAASPPTTADLRDLVYELLDAHYDTAVLAEELASDDAWSSHLRYLSELQRVGREQLAETSPELVA
jgi:hypothetical protein